jgi:hypothetical protein
VPLVPVLLLRGVVGHLTLRVVAGCVIGQSTDLSQGFTQALLRWGSLIKESLDHIYGTINFIYAISLHTDTQLLVVG